MTNNEANTLVGLTVLNALLGHKAIKKVISQADAEKIADEVFNNLKRYDVLNIEEA